MQFEQELHSAVRQLAGTAQIEICEPEKTVRIRLGFGTQLQLMSRDNMIESKCTVFGRNMVFVLGTICCLGFLLSIWVALKTQSRIAVFFSLLPAVFVLRWWGRVVLVRDFARGVLWRRWGAGAGATIALSYQLAIPRNWFTLIAAGIAIVGFWFLI